MHLKCKTFQKFSTLRWLYSPRHWGIFSAAFLPVPNSPVTSSPGAAWLCTGSPISPQSAWPIWSSWSAVSSGSGVAQLLREPNHLWPAQMPVWALGGSFHMLVSRLWALLAQIQKDVLAWTLCCPMVKILEIVWARVENRIPLYTWDWGKLYKPGMGHPAFTLSDHRKLPTAFEFHIFPLQLHIFPDREGATACSLALVRFLVITGSSMNALSSRSSLAHILVCALKYQYDMECLSMYQVMTQVFSNWIWGNLQSVTGSDLVHRTFKWAWSH